MLFLNLFNTIATASTSNVQIWMIIPFILLLLLIAIMPLTPDKIKHFWEKNYPVIAIGLGLIVTLYYVILVTDGSTAVWHSVKEYLSFIALVGSLFIISGGIAIHLSGEATPRSNIIFLLFGAILANLIGTTGASMLLIRPWMKMNKYRLSGFHIVFFIFIISNVGGALTPIGDPPLYIGYLRGIPFFWILEHAILPWTFVIGALLAVFFIFDIISFKKAGKRGEIAEKTGERTTLSLKGGINIMFLILIVVAVLLPAQVSEETAATLNKYFIREIAMIVIATLSFKLTRTQIHEENKFTFEPIKEVAFLFAGIFLTMVPALAYLSAHGSELGITQPYQYFFASGILSGFLDNTPTYANFFDLIKANIANTPEADKLSMMLNMDLIIWKDLVAISLGSVFFGALTYIGNGPNFMVKSIAENANVKMPTFFGYLFKYGICILLPILILCSLFFLL